ncbi:MAG: subclass B1 metallo-beta-lactamase [bacterium]
MKRTAIHAAGFMFMVCHAAGLMLMACLVLSSCTALRHHSKTGLDDSALRLGTVQLSSDLIVRQLAEGIWLHTSTKNIEQYGGPVPSNGLLVVTSDGAVLIDTAWTDEQTTRLLDWAEGSLGAKVRLLIVTHAHEDRLGGIRAAHARGVVSHGSDLTGTLAQKGGWPPLMELFSGQRSLQVGNRQMELFFPGHGHSPDNIVVWLSRERILVGGCLVKDLHANNLGNLADADINSWKNAIIKVMTKYPGVDLIIPGHGEPGGENLLKHTLMLLNRVHP